MKIKFFILLTALLASFPCAYASDILKVRIGIHPDKTRLVVDLNKKTDYTLLKAGKAKQSEFIFFNTSASPSLLRAHQGNGIIKSYTFRKGRNKEIILSIQTNKDAQIEKFFSIKKGKQHPFRVVIDLKREISTKTSQHTSSVPQKIPLTPIKKKKAPQITSAPLLDIPYPLTKPLRMVIVLDAGHGGHDPGTISRNGVQEKNITLAVAKMIKKEIEKQGKHLVILTRSRDEYVPLRKRFSIARKSQANLLISLHADSNPNKSVKGLAVYTLSSTASDKEAERLALKENASDFLSDLNFTHDHEPEIKNILIDLSQTRTRNLSINFCEILMKKFTKAELLSNNTHRSAGFTVLKAPDVASVLIELGYLSNPEDRKRLTNTVHQRRVALKIAQAVHDYFKHSEK